MSGSGARRDSVAALVDLHVHTQPKSLDSSLDPRAMAERARQLGLTAVCLTEHNETWTPSEMAAVLGDAGIAVICGMEVSTDAGHVLVFGVHGFSVEMLNVERLRAITEYEGGAMVLAHPGRAPGFGRPWSEARHLFEALEGMNGDDHNRSAAYVLDLAAGLGMPVTGGSDAHTLPAVGRRATAFQAPVTNEQELIQALRGGRYWPVEPAAGRAPVPRRA